jgi:hypothetical protein
MTIVIVDEDIASLEVSGDIPTDLPIKMCDVHQAELLEKLGVHRDLEHIVFHGITSACCRSIGTITVTQFGCPVCAIQKFDYIGETIALTTSNYQDPHGAKCQ